MKEVKGKEIVLALLGAVRQKEIVLALLSVVLRCLSPQASVGLASDQLVQYHLRSLLPCLSLFLSYHPPIPQTLSHLNYPCHFPAWLPYHLPSTAPAIPGPLIPCCPCLIELVLSTWRGTEEAVVNHLTPRSLLGHTILVAYPTKPAGGQEGQTTDQVPSSLQPGCHGTKLVATGPQLTRH